MTEPILVIKYKNHKNDSVILTYNLLHGIDLDEEEVSTLRGTRRYMERPNGYELKSDGIIKCDTDFKASLMFFDKDTDMEPLLSMFDDSN